ncbi:MAG: coproporphyrinogen dehydrogenase HemZ, partial [Clostridiales bacterium]|nr:coproporphyrinogen dehydrogenase HemZ [Clostridiales bacterium]
LSLFEALRTAVAGICAPWGALTGIRPSKLIRAWLAEGLGEREITRILTDEIHCRRDKAELALAVARAEVKLTGRIFAKPGTAPNLPLGLYISVPFCPSRCAYCSFNLSNQKNDRRLYEAYLSALEVELREKAEEARGLNGVVTSAYIGGGTPTVLPGGLLEKLMEITAPFTANGDVEFTVEAGRPDSITHEKLKIMKAYGVNRLAVNPQTLNDHTLAVIGREHTAADFFRAFEAARSAGFECINTDIIAGLPGETPEDFEKTLNGILPLAPENFTVHTLAVKRSSRLNEAVRSGEAEALTPPEAVEEMHGAAKDACGRSGLTPYYLYRQKNAVGLSENVGYSKPGRECLYNIGMMAETQTVLGAGAGAVSKYVDGSRITRKFNVKNPELYIANQLNF